VIVSCTHIHHLMATFPGTSGIFLLHLFLDCASSQDRPKLFISPNSVQTFFRMTPLPHSINPHHHTMFHPTDLILMFHKSKPPSSLFLNYQTDRFQPQQFSVCLYVSVSLHYLMAIFPGEPELASTRMSPFWILLEQRIMEMVVTTGAKMYKVPVKSSPPTYQHPAIYMSDALPVAQPTVSEQERESPTILSSLHFFFFLSI